MRVKLLIGQEVVQKLLRTTLLHLGLRHSLWLSIKVSLGLDHLLVKPRLSVLVEIL